MPPCSLRHTNYMSLPKGDLLVDEKYLLEIGGRNKTFKQVADVPDSYVVADDEETGIGNKDSIVDFGFLY